MYHRGTKDQVMNKEIYIMHAFNMINLSPSRNKYCVYQYEKIEVNLRSIKRERWK